jgi:predicted molibdopterin-dependent oxidoreductase YjgC
MKEKPEFKRLGKIDRGKSLQIKVDGAVIPAFAGETVATAMLSAGLLRCQTHEDRPLGVFCNIGQCCSCLMTINGVSGVRACQTSVSPGLEIQTRNVQKRGPGR